MEEVRVKLQDISSRINSIETKVNDIEKETHHQVKVSEKVEEAIEKIQDVFQSMNNLLIIHQEKITAQSATNGDLLSALRDQKHAFASDIDILHNKISKTEREIKDDIAKLQISLTAEREVRKDSHSSVTATLDKYKWAVYGGLFVLGVVVKKLNIFEIIFGN